MRKIIQRIFFLLLIAVMIPISAFAQHKTALPFSVEGILTDSVTHEKEPFATIRIMAAEAPDKLIKAAVTDINGHFSIGIPAPGNYYATFTSIGKLTVARSFTLTEKTKHIDLGTICTAEETKMLKGITVVAQKPLVKAEIDKIAYSVEDDPDSKTQSTLEMLRKIPLVTVDGEDNIKVNGSESFKVHVNGKPNTLMSNNPKEVLRSLPASSIKSIEVITEPGAKYDAEGIGGILNIVTVGTKMDGYNVTLGTKAGNQEIGGYGYGTFQVNKLTIAANYSYTHNDSPKGYNSSGREDFKSESNKFLNTDGWTDSNKGYFQFGNLEASYEINPQHLLTLSANLYGGNFKGHSGSFTQMLDARLTPTYSYQSQSKSESDFKNLNVNFDYQYSFKKPGEYLTLSYKFNHAPNESENRSHYLDKKDVPFELQDQYFDNEAHTSEHTAQIDYVNPINKIHYLDAGMKYIFRTNESESHFFLQQPDGSMQESLSQSDFFNQGQDILAAYADYQLKWKQFGLKAGVRYEHTFMDVNYQLTPERNFDARFNDVVPAVNLSYIISPTRSLRANYNLRINRPSIWYLNPFKDTSNPTSIRYGNPNLETEKAHLFGLTYSSFSAKFSTNISLNYLFTNNGIEAYSFMNNGILENTYENAGKKQNTKLAIWMNWNPGNTTRLSLNMEGNYTDLKSDMLNIQNRNSGFSGSFFANVQQSLPWDLRLSLYGGGSTPSVSLQGKGNAYHYYGLSLNRSFLKEKRLNVSVYGSNIFNKYQTFKNETVTDTFRSWTHSKYGTQRFGISISWRFGNLKTKVKETVRSIHNDDVKAGGSSQGGASGSGNASAGEGM